MYLHCNKTGIAVDNREQRAERRVVRAWSVMPLDWICLSESGMQMARQLKRILFNILVADRQAKTSCFQSTARFKSESLLSTPVMA